MAKFTVNNFITDIIERLEALDKIIVVDDMGYKITEGENASGSWDCSYAEAKQDICDNWDYIANFMDAYGDELMAWDPFKDTELFHDVIMIESYRMLFEHMVHEIGIDLDEEYNTITIGELLRKAYDDNKFATFELDWLVM